MSGTPVGPQRYRSLLFVPAHKLDWILKSPKYGADGLILDLEDAVPDDRKAEGRQTCLEGLRALSSHSIARFVRVNAWGTGWLVDDIATIIDGQPTGIVLPKVSSPRDVISLDALLTELELAKGLPVGQVEIFLLCETAEGLRDFYQIAIASPRVKRSMGGPTANPTGDTIRALGYEWSESGLESLYLNSKVMLEAKAAGLAQVFGGMSASIDDLEPLRRTAMRSRQLGGFGTVVIHPSHVPVVHEVFAPGPRQIDNAIGTLRAMDEAVRRGDAATVYQGRMVDIAHARHAAMVLREAERLGVGGVPSVSSLWSGDELLAGMD